MDTTEIRQELEDLRSQIHFHNFRYNVLDDPLISDVEYDRLIARLKTIEAEHPEEPRQLPKVDIQREAAFAQGGRTHPGEGADVP